MSVHVSFERIKNLFAARQPQRRKGWCGITSTKALSQHYHEVKRDNHLIEYPHTAQSCRSRTECVLFYSTFHSDRQIRSTRQHLRRCYRVSSQLPLPHALLQVPPCPRKLVRPGRATGQPRRAHHSQGGRLSGVLQQLLGARRSDCPQGTPRGFEGGATLKCQTRSMV